MTVISPPHTHHATKAQTNTHFAPDSFTFEGRGYRLGGAEGVCVRERTLPSVADGLYSEAVAAGLRQSLDLVGVAGTTVDRHKPGRRYRRNERRKLRDKFREKSVNDNEG